MNLTFDLLKHGRRATQALALLTVAIGVAALIGWTVNSRMLCGFSTVYIPMAPNTALCFIALGIALLFQNPPSLLNVILIRILAAPVILIAAIRLIEMLLGIEFAVDRWFLDPPAQFLHKTPVARMALFTSINFLFAGSSIFLLSLQPSKRNVENIAGLMALVTGMLGFAFFVGYALGSPLLYGSTIIPMAFNTAIAFFTLGLGILLTLLANDIRRQVAEGEEPTLAVDRKILAGFGLALSALFIVSIISFDNTQQAINSTRRLAHTHEVLAEMQAVFSTVKEVESASRGFVLTENEILLEDFHTASRRLNTHLKRLRSLTSDNTAQQSLLDSLEVLARQKVRFNTRIVDVCKEEGPDTARQLIRSGVGIITMAEIQTIITAMGDYENTLLQQYADEQERSSTNTVVTFSLLAALVVSILAAIYAVVHRDLVGRQRAEEEARRTNSFLDNVIENIPAMIFLKDAATLQFLRFNKAGEELTGYTQQERIGKTAYDFFPKHQADSFTADDRKVLETRSVVDVSEERLQTKNKGTRILHTRKIALCNEQGTPEYLLGISVDITERKRAEEQIKVLNRDLERRAAELEAANKELEAFSYSVSHDLRAPLRHIDGFADLLRQHASDRLDEKGHRYVNTIADSAKQMGQLIDDLLVFSRVGRTEMVKVTVPLSGLLMETLSKLQKEAEGRSIDWRIHALPEVQGDPSLLRQVLINLLSNAIKYTRPTQNACIEIGAVMQDNDFEHVIYVRDNGVGFDMEYAQKLFGVFQRLHSSADFEGTGIGLANVRRIIARHGGRTWAEGELGKGATFYISLPANP